ncbi:surfeit locus protein 2 isoform 1-T1 [Discoglossus pictus]
MEQLPADVEAFIQQHPSLKLVEGNKIRCSLTGHELPCRLPELISFTNGKKYKRLTKTTTSTIDYSNLAPHIVPSTKNPHQLFCKLTLRHINKLPEHIQKHVEGKRYRRALCNYEECQKQGVEYVPACLKGKNKQKHSGRERPAGKKREMWEPAASNSEGSDSEDSMSDLYPNEMFSKNEQDGDSDEEMGVEMAAAGQPQNNKRQKKQNGPSKKKFKKSKNFKTPAAM